MAILTSKSHLPHPSLRVRIALFGLVAILGTALALTTSRRATDEITSSKNLWLIAKFPLAIPEPSGLALAADGESLWAVSDSNGHVYQISLQGEILRCFDTGLRDLEGITTIDAFTLAVIAERDREIVVFGTDGSLLRRGKINLSGPLNKGPEGLCYDEKSGEFLVINEHCGSLIRLNRDFEELHRRPLKLARDYSSLSYETDTHELWVMSDRSQSINVLNKDFAIIDRFTTNIRQLEGLAIDKSSGRLYMISDPQAALFVFGFTQK
jgi:uncharacterized protein YjiK